MTQIENRRFLAAVALALLAGSVQASPASVPSATRAAAVGMAGGDGERIAYPARPVRFIVPAESGAEPDADSAALARILAQQLGRRLGQPFVVETVPGAQGTEALARVAHAVADGYTIALGTMATTMLARALHARLPYDPASALAPIARVGASPAVLVARADLPADDLQGFVSFARAAARPFQYATPGRGTIGHLCAAVIGQKTGADLEAVHFEGAAPVITALRDSVAKAGWVDAVTAMAAIRAGEAKPLAACASRAPGLPDVATLQEQGVDFGLWTGWAIYGPAGIPGPVVRKLADALRETLQDPAVVAALHSAGIAADYLPGDAHLARAARDSGNWRRIAREAGIQPR